MSHDKGVSLGYTPVVAKNMAAEALVQHAPWGGDGGKSFVHVPVYVVFLLFFFFLKHICERRMRRACE